MTKFTEVTEARYDEMLGCLPPAVWDDKGFLVGEPWDHDETGRPRFSAFIHCNGKFYESNGPMTVRDYKAMQKREFLACVEA